MSRPRSFHLFIHTVHEQIGEGLTLRNHLIGPRLFKNYVVAFYTEGGCTSPYSFLHALTDSYDEEREYGYDGGKVRDLPRAGLIVRRSPPPLKSMRHLLLAAACLSSGSGLTLPVRQRTSPAAAARAAPAAMALRPVLRSTAAALGAANLAHYHWQLIRSEEAGQPTWRAVQAATRRSWAEFVQETSGWLYAIQTLRNAITASTFLASTVLSLFTLMMGYLRNSMLERFEWLVVLRFSCTGVLMLCSAYSFLQSARLMTHAGFMFPVAQGATDSKADGGTTSVATARVLPAEPGGTGSMRASYTLRPCTVGTALSKSETNQWAGLRFLYLSLSGVVWIVGGEFAFLAVTLALRRFFAGIDRPPALAEIDVVSRDDGGAGYTI